MTSRTTLAIAVVLLVAGLCRAEPAAAPPRDAQIRRAIERGTDWLTSAQHADGSWGSGRFRGSVAVTANAALAMVAAGNTPSSGPRAESLGKAVDFLIDACDDGLFASREPGSRGPMYGHAYATLLLAELLGEIESPGLRDRLALAGELLERTQNEEGGWRYQARRGDADISVTSAVVVALSALEKSGVPVSRPCIDRAIAYIERLQNADGGFRYQSPEGISAAPRTAAALLALIVTSDRGAGRQRDTILRAAEWLERNPVRLAGEDAYALYGFAASANTFWQIGGSRWASFFGPAARDLLDAQAADGSWADPSCREFGTAAAVITLAAPDGLTPLFQP